MRPQQPTRRDVLAASTLVAGGLALSSCHSLPRAATPTAAGPKLPGYLEVRGTRFFRDDKPFFVNGFNYWSALPLSREGNTAGWDQLRRDLDSLQGLGVNMLRIMGGTEGPDSESLRIVPSLQPSPGQYDPASVTGLLKLVRELESRKLFAIVMMNNFWHWSGGMAQYLAWAGEGAIPYPPPHPGGSWDRYQKHTARFYSSAKAKTIYADLLRFLVPQLKSSPAVIWELANEPRGINNISAFRSWVDETAGLFKTLAPSQLVTTGSEGQTAAPFYSGTDVVHDHESPNIDFITFHLWAQNWGWVRPESLEKGLPKALELAKKYLTDHASRAAKLGKPLLLEEFGFPRDGGSFDPDSPTTLRDRYFEEIYGQVHSLMATSPMAGIMPWAWSGDTRPPRPGEFWKPGDPFIGDPPHEQQGWYGLYTKDTTLKIIQSHGARAVS
ncbi:MAG: cellulase family glycosylhydrolase [Haliangium ochraceum]